MKTIYISITIQGITPLLCVKFTDEAAMRASAGSCTSAAAIDRGTPQEIAEGQLYLGLNGKPMIPQPNLLRCLVDGGQFFKAGRRQITTKESSLLVAAIDIEGTEIEIRHKQPWKVDTRPVVIPATKGRILAHRPMFDDWELVFLVKLDIKMINEKLFREIVDAAGSRIGLGGFRPVRKGPYGRFHVINWKVMEAGVPAKKIRSVA
jgi:hypothetical protein